MFKFAVELTKGNIETILGICESKAEAMEFGRQCFDALPKGAGIISCVETDFDENNRRTSLAERIYHVWR